MKKVLSVWMALLLLISLLALPVAAAPATSKQTKRAIAIVFDNSGSMYMPDGDNQEFCYAWCRATYAMEAFATMMNENDVMHIYPMWPIEVRENGKTVGKYSSSNPLKVTQSNANVIENICTPMAKGTPLTTITDAFKGLTKMSADEKWLIVLTDGTTFDDHKNDSKEAVQKELNQCVKKVNVAYLGIGENALLPTAKGGKHQFIAKKANSSTQVLGELTDMCNTIFGREELKGVTNTVKFDVSMNKLIVFIQGAGIDNVKLGDKTGEACSLKYGQLGCDKTAMYGTKKTWLVDETLQGKLLTFVDDPNKEGDELPAGEYKLSFTGNATSVVCYYEPNVKMAVKLLDDKGIEVDPNSKLTEGNYSIQYALVDGITNQPTTSALLGKTQYKFMVGEQEYTSNEAGTLGPIALKANDELAFDYEVTYLDGYTLKGDSTEFGWPFGGIKFFEKLGDLEASITGGSLEYFLSKLEGSPTYRVTFTYNGKSCSDKVLASLEKNLSVSFDGKKMSYTATREGQDFIIALTPYGGVPIDTDTGHIKMTVSSQYINENGDASNQAGVTADFIVKDDSRTLDMSVVRGQSYYQISKLDSSKPIVVKLNYSGDPLTAKELEAVNLTYEPSDLKLLLEPDYENSQILVKFDPENPPKSDDYNIEFTAKSKNEIGKPQSVTKKTAVEVGKWPMWLKILLPIAIILLLILLVVWWLRQPRLPKRIDISNPQYILNGEAIPTTGLHAQYTGGGKKTGELRISSPNSPIDPMARQGVTLDLVAVTPRRVKSRQRKASVQSFRALNAAQVQDLRIRNMSFKPDDETPGRLVQASNGQPMSRPIEIGHNAPIAIASDTGDTNASFNCTLTFN